MSIIDLANIYGIKPSFYVKGKDTYFTKFTLFISILSILVIAFFIIYFGKELLYKTKQNLLFSTITDKEPLALNLSSSNFVLSFSLQYENYTSFIDNKIYNIKAELVSSYIDKEINEKIINYTPLDVVKCSNYHFNLISDYFKTKDLNNLYCLNNNNLIIKGGFDNENYQFIKIQFNFCDNSLNYNCEDLESIKQKFKGGYVTIFYSDLSIQSKNYSHPAIINGRNKVTTFSSNYYKEFTLYFKNKIIQTDKGLVFTNIEKSYYYSFENSEEYIDFRNYDYNFFNLFIRPSSEHDEYLRSYTKATSVIADISGMFKLIMVIGHIICITTDLIFYKLYILSFFDLNYNLDIDSKKKNIFSLLNVVKSIKENKKDPTSLRNVGKLPSLYQIYEIDNMHRKDKEKVLKTIIMTKNSIHSTKFNDIKKKLFCKENNNNSINTTNINNNNSNNNSINNNNNKICNSYRNDYILNKYKENFNLYDFNQNIYKTKSLRHKRIKLKEMRNENMEKNLSCCNLFYLAFCEKSKKTIYGKKLSNFQNILIYLDIIRYLKIFHDLHLLKRYILSDKDFKKIESDYLFDKNSKITTDLFYNNFENYFENDNEKNKKKKDKKEKKSEKKTDLKKTDLKKEEKEEDPNKTKTNNNSSSRGKKWNLNNTQTTNEINISILNKNDLDDIKIKLKKKKKKKTIKNKNLDNIEKEKQEKSINNLLSTDYI